ncbi:hypothetical protein ACIFOC_02993 [Leucobacter aridicollis]
MNAATPVLEEYTALPFWNGTAFPLPTANPGPAGHPHGPVGPPDFSYADKYALGLNANGLPYGP